MYNPRITVLMSVYNSECYLNEAIDSILTQTFTDFEFLIIDYASTDNTPDILRSYHDPRITIITNEENLGLTRSLNNGLAVAQGDYIARMDADDISLPERLDEQVQFMDNNPHICVCGSWVEIIGQNAGDIWRYPTSHDEIACRHLFECSIAHPSVILNRKYLNENQIHYNNTFKKSQDYELWVRISRTYALANIGKVLLKLRIHAGAIGQMYTDNQKEWADLVRFQQLSEFLCLHPTSEERILHSLISTGAFDARNDYVHGFDMWLQKIWNANKERKHFNESVLFNELSTRWYMACKNTTNQGYKMWKQYRYSPFFEGDAITRIQKYSLFITCLLKRGLI
jgi:glycosyltransferase involved in cell wall biosynthesis